MIKKSASRNQRSKGVKVKHVLQILLLLCICFWLLYQIKCSYDRSRGVSEKASKTLVKEEGEEEDDSGGGLKLGRKDLREKQREEEDEDEGNQGDREDVVDVDDEEIRRDVEKLEAQERLEEQERLEGKKDEGDEEDADNRMEDEGREEEEGSNDKMDEVDDERGDNDSEINEAEEVEGAEIDREEDFLDEDKGGREERIEDEGEEDDGGDKDEQVGDDDVLEDKDPDEAREAHYQADVASGAVARHTQYDDENAGEEESNHTRVGDRLTEYEGISLSEKDSEATAITMTKAEAYSNVSEGNKQASNVSVLEGTEFTGSMGNVAESVIDLPVGWKLASPNKDRDDVSLGQTTDMKTENVSSAKKTQSYQTDSTLDTSTQEPVKPSDLSSKQTLWVSDDVSNWDKGQEIDGVLKTQPAGKDQGNVIQMELPNEHNWEESRTL